jgi:hypothetical protein
VARAAKRENRFMSKPLAIELPPSVAALEKIGEDECLCGIPGCEGHPVVISGDREVIEFSADEYEYLLADLQYRMRIANGEAA